MAVFFFHCEFSERLRVLRKCGIDLGFFCNKVVVLGRRRRAWSLRVLTLVDFIGTIKFMGFGYKVGQSGRHRGNTKQFLVYPMVQVLLEHIDLSVFIGARASGKGGPFLVPFIESTSTLLHIKHVLLGKISGYDGDKMFIKGGFEIGP